MPPSSLINLLYISRLDHDKQKAVEAVMKAVAMIFPERPQLRLRIIGDGRQYRKIKKKVRTINARLGRDIIAVDGWVDDLTEHFSNADIIIGAGRCVLEAIASGRTALVVGNEKIGGLVTAGNFHSLQKANFSGRGSAVTTSFENMLRELKKISPGAVFDDEVRALAQNDHDAAKLAAEIREIYLELLSGKNKH